MVVTSQPIERLHYGASRVLDNFTPVAWDRNFELLLLLLSTTITNTSTTTTTNVHHYCIFCTPAYCIKYQHVYSNQLSSLSPGIGIQHLGIVYR